MVVTGEVTNVQTNSAQVAGDVIDTGEGIVQHGHCWDTSPDPNVNGKKTLLGPVGEPKNFTSDLTTLTAGTTYYVRAYSMNSNATIYGKEITLKTTDPSLPTLTTVAISSITSTTAISGGNITNNGGAPIIARGICWSKLTDPIIADPKTSDGTETGNFTSNIIGLTPGETYHVRAYATNSAGTAYGADIPFTAKALLPTISTGSILSVTQTTASISGNVTSDGGAQVIEKGVCWNILPDPTINNNKTMDGTGVGTFNSNVSGLTEGTIYHVRAYATNSSGTAYGADISISTVTKPTLTTSSVRDITQISAAAGGNVTSDGGASVSAKGVCWSTSINPTISLITKTSDGTGTGTFASNISDLTPNTLYYIRAYATNFAGTSYGDQITFSTQLSDIDGNIYSTVVIGIQVWMVENLKVIRYNDGTNIPLVTDNGQWGSLKSSSYCWYNNDISYKNRLGAIYSGYVVFNATSKNVCPVGWHVPTDGDWTTLTTFLGGETVSGGKLKETGTTIWESPNNGATNETGFSALPGGERNPDGSFDKYGFGGYWWSSSLSTLTAAWYRYMDRNYPTVARSNIDKSLGYSIRCLRDP